MRLEFHFSRELKLHICSSKKKLRPSLGSFLAYICSPSFGCPFCWLILCGERNWMGEDGLAWLSLKHLNHVWTLTKNESRWLNHFCTIFSSFWHDFLLVFLARIGHLNHESCWFECVVWGLRKPFGKLQILQQRKHCQSLLLHKLSSSFAWKFSMISHHFFLCFCSIQSLDIDLRDIFYLWLGNLDLVSAVVLCFGKKFMELQQVSFFFQIAEAHFSS